MDRAQKKEFLKHKMERRPDRQILVQQHILEDTVNTVSPTIHIKQRQLKKARLTDDLNDRLSHRPGPLELVKGNILLADSEFVQAVKEGQIQFKATSEGKPIKHPPPRFIIKEESSSDDAASPSRPNDKPIDFSNDTDLGSSSFIPSATTVPTTNFEIATSSSNPTANINITDNTKGVNNYTNNNILSLTQGINLIQFATNPDSTQTLTLGTFNCIPIATTATPTLSTVFPTFTSVATNNVLSNNQCQQPMGNAAININPPTSTTLSNLTSSPTTKESGPILTKNRKKSKSKSQPKTKTIKFHEYKGPPSAQKQQSSNNDTETSYELLLKQQQLFLQLQLEWQNKQHYTPTILPSFDSNGTGNNSNNNNFCNCQKQFLTTNQAKGKNSLPNQSDDLAATSPSNASTSVKASLAVFLQQQKTNQQHLFQPQHQNHRLQQPQSQSQSQSEQQQQQLQLQLQQPQPQSQSQQQQSQSQSQQQQLQLQLQLQPQSQQQQQQQQQQLQLQLQQQQKQQPQSQSQSQQQQQQQLQLQLQLQQQQQLPQSQQQQQQQQSQQQPQPQLQPQPQPQLHLQSQSQSQQQQQSLFQSQSRSQLQQQLQQPQSQQQDITIDSLFNDLLDFQSSPMNVDYASWLTELMTDNCPFKSSVNSSSSYATNVRSKQSSSMDHDPVLANNFAETYHYGDPLIDLYFGNEN